MTKTSQDMQQLMYLTTSESLRWAEELQVAAEIAAYKELNWVTGVAPERQDAMRMTMHACALSAE